MPESLPPMTIEELLALPVSVDLETAGRAFGLGRTKAHELARAEEFPCPVKVFGKRYRVLRADLLPALGIDPAMVAGQRAAADEPLQVPAIGHQDGLPGEVLRVLYDALLAAAQVLVDRRATP
jgi:hypothetical protein